MLANIVANVCVSLGNDVLEAIVEKLCMEDAVLEKINEGEHCVTFSDFVN